MGYAVAARMAAAWVIREVAERRYAAGPLPEPAPSGDAVDDLGDEIATLAEHIHTITHRFLALVARFDELRGWERAGYANCADWLAVRCDIDRVTAREKVRTARALAGLPLTSAAMARGELSFCQARALTRQATPDCEAELLELARGATVHELERSMRAWRKGRRQDEAERERARHASRAVSLVPDDDGMYVLRGRLTPEVGALLMRAIEAAADRIFHDRPEIGETEEERRRLAAQRRADALELLAARALEAGFATEDGAPVSGTRAERYQVMLHVDAATLSEDGQVGRSELEDGTRVSCEASRRIACDAGRVDVVRGPGDSVLDVGRRTRTIPPALRRALEVRDRGCRFPGCGRRFTDAHHVRHWADGGETSLGNCLLLCRHHHRLVHEGGWRIEWWGGRPAFFDPRGGMQYSGR
jgi:hypothetical protein